MRLVIFLLKQKQCKSILKGFMRLETYKNTYRQTATAARTYCIAALITQRWLSAYNLIQEDEIIPETQGNRYKKESASVTYIAYFST